MNFKRMAVALAIGLFISGFCTYLLSRSMRSKGSQPVPQLKYVAPVRALQAGEALKNDNVELVNWPASQPIADAFAKPELVFGRALLYPVDKGQPITEKFLTAVGAGSGLAGRIPDGMRAIALRSDEVVGVAGFLLPGSHVDVLATVQTVQPGTDAKGQTATPEPTTFNVLQNAEVLAAGHQIEPDPAGKPVSVTVVTLLLSPLDAERAVLASQQGSIHFILRSGSDTDKPKDTPVQLSHLVSGITPPAAVVRKLVAKPQSVHALVVQTISGDKTTNDSFPVIGK